MSSGDRIPGLCDAECIGAKVPLPCVDVVAERLHGVVEGIMGEPWKEPGGGEDAGMDSRDA
jgi:hypothetical protein